MKKLTLILFSIFLAVQAQAQFSVSYSFGYGTYKMDDMKELLKTAQNMINNQYPGFDARIVNNFPDYINHNLELGYKIKNHEFGIKSSYLTTGGKLSRADYSGKYEEKITLTSFREGFFYRNYLYTNTFGNKSNFSIFGEVSPSFLFSKLKTKGHISIGDKTQNFDSENVTHTSFSILPQIGFKYNLTPQIGFLISTGYDVNLSTKTDKLGENGIDWSGFRISGGVSFTFN